MTMRSLFWFVAAAELGLMGPACAATQADESGGGAAGTSDAASEPSTGGSGGMLEGGILDTGLGDANPDGACDYIVEQGTRTPLSLYIMYDKSASMVGGKWESAKAGMQAFLEDPKSTGIMVAFNLFPRDPDGTPECDAKAYKTARVDYGPLPQNATAILALLDGETPDGTGTPIYPALGGAILAARDVAKPGASSAVLLVTDGEPQGPASLCAGVDPEDPQAIADLASTAAGWNPPVHTYVIGLPGANQSFANLVAAAGSGVAILVGSNDVQTEFQKALASVLGKALPCEFEIPEKVDKGEIDPTNVNVLYTPGGNSQFEYLYGVPDPSSPDCSQGDWYYDDPAHPTRIILCPGTCSTLKEDLEGKLEIMLGCKTMVK
jgi:hypothetical protein